MSELHQGSRIGGRYVLIDRLGVGGMGEVWLAELEGAGAFRRRVVIKMLAPERRGDASVAAMLADEARLVGLLHHPGIISAVDYLESEKDGPIFVLEFVDGCSLRTSLKVARRRNDLLPEVLAAHVGAQVARALQAAHNACDRDGHSLHLVHRDISPENVLLSRSGAVYLGDFGVARARGGCTTEVTDPGAGPKGKLGYMAPEQASGGTVGPQADIFSLGRVVAEAATVRVGHSLRKVIEKATAMDPRHRYQTAAELAAALSRACPPPPDPEGALSAWLHRAAPEALQHRRTADGSAPAVRVDAPPAGIPAAVTPSRIARKDPLFAEVARPRRRALKIVAALGVLIALALPTVFIVREVRSARERRPAGMHAVGGELRVSSRPAGAQVYVDGALRGVTPLTLELDPGQHSVRVGSERLSKWRTADVKMFSGSSGQLDFDLD